MNEVLFARTFLIGLAVAAPVGAMGVLCMQRTLKQGPLAGLATGLGIATADALYAGMAAFGVAAVASTLVKLQVPLRIVGGLALIYLGIKALKPAQSCDADTEIRKEAPLALYLSAVGLTLTNPMTIMAFGAIFAGAGLSVAPTLSAAGLATVGVALGSLTWWVALVIGVSFAKQGLGDEFSAWVSRVSGIVIAAFGVIAIGSVILG